MSRLLGRLGRARAHPHAKCPRAASEMRGTAHGCWDGDGGSVFSTRLGVGGVARRAQR